MKKIPTVDDLLAAIDECEGEQRNGLDVLASASWDNLLALRRKLPHRVGGMVSLLLLARIAKACRENSAEYFRRMEDMDDKSLTHKQKEAFALQELCCARLLESIIEEWNRCRKSQSRTPRESAKRGNARSSSCLASKKRAARSK